MTDWIPFYATLIQGRKRALPRSCRFIFLELCLTSRANGGVIEMVPGLDVCEFVWDLLGGNRREVTQAVGLLTAEDMIDVGSQPGFMIVKTWDRWKLKDKTNAERQARFRERKRNALVTARNVTPTVTVTLPRVTRNGSRSDQIRSEAAKLSQANKASSAVGEPRKAAARSKRQSKTGHEPNGALPKPQQVLKDSMSGSTAAEDPTWVAELERARQAEQGAKARRHDAVAVVSAPPPLAAIVTQPRKTR